MFKLSLVASVLLLVQVCWTEGISPRVTSGHNAKPGEFPHHVAIYWSLPPFIPKKFICSGSIIGEQHVLTAGNCVRRLGKTTVLAGKHYLAKNEGRLQQESEAERSYFHPLYQGSHSQHDIAVLKLKTPFVFNERVKAIRLDENNERDLSNGVALFSGWGSISRKLFPVKPTHYILQTANFNLLPNDQCFNITQTHKNFIVPNAYIYDTQVCTINSNGASVCSGDSGGALVQMVNGTMLQIGVASWGYYPCGKVNLPSIFTRVSSYVDWIHRYIPA
ncbi:mast cell tryptase-like [Prorops nasuta]|uniref:mast cell tryptase-like n=1 Tax=Prorops nasuta TaxID=863751 RepID=UPI0034CDD7EC